MTVLTATSCTRPRPPRNRRRPSLENAQLYRTRNEDLFQRGIAARKDVEDARTQESVAAAAMQQSEAALELRATAGGALRNRLAAQRHGGETIRERGRAGGRHGRAAHRRSGEPPGSGIPRQCSRDVPREDACRRNRLRHQRISCPGESSRGAWWRFRRPSIPPPSGPGAHPHAESGGLLRMGMFLSAQIAVETHANALAVPPEAIYRDGQGRRACSCVEQETATAVPVKMGIETKDRVEIAPTARERRRQRDPDGRLRPGRQGQDPDQAAVEPMNVVRFCREQ